MRAIILLLLSLFRSAGALSTNVNPHCGADAESFIVRYLCVDIFLSLFCHHNNALCTPFVSFVPTKHYNSHNGTAQ